MSLKCNGVFLVICVLILIQPSFVIAEYLPAQTDSPSSRIHPCMGFDSVNERVVLFGGGTMSGVREDTWMYVYSTNTWTQISSVSDPEGRNDASMVYDPTTNCMILFGGWGPTLGWGEDTWIFNCTTDEWTEVTPDNSPPPRSSSNMVYDSTNNIAILFGGYAEGGNTLDDTWSYNVTENIWTEMSPTVHPCSRYGHCMIYDPINSRTILFSGNSINGMNADLWEYNLTSNSWIELFPSTNPLGRKWGTMVYDPDMNRGILFGGDCNDPEFVNDTWAFNCSTSEWELQNPELSPCVRANAGLAYDTTNNLIVLFGGQSGGFGGDYYSMDDTWVFIDSEWVDMSTIPSSSGTTSNEALPVEWIIVGIAIPVIIGIVLLMRKKMSE